MKRNTILATVGALSMLAVPAMADDGPGYRTKRYKNDDVSKHRRGVRRPAPLPAPVMLPAVKSFGPHAAKAGATVTIKGTHFMPGMKVMLGRTLITPTVVRPRRIKFTVPARARDGALSLVMPNGRRAIRVGALDVITPPRRFRRGWYDTNWKRTRFSRRNQSRRGILTRWQNRFFLSSAAARAELRLHARRSAQLKRMKRLARSTGRNGLARRINAAIRKEDARHARKMTNLKSRFDVRFAAGRY